MTSIIVEVCMCPERPEPELLMEDEEERRVKVDFPKGKRGADPV